MDWLNEIPRYRLGHWPTPLEPLQRLSQELGGPAIWVKRDDCSGLLTGGNKTRKLEYLIADALSEGADTVVTFGAVQSNHARQTAAACAKTGLECHLILTRRVPWKSDNYETNGNILLNQLCDAHIHIMESEDAEAKTGELIDSLQSESKKVYLIPPGGSNATGALGYTVCVDELKKQIEEKKINKPIIFHASASAGTQSGLVFGIQTIGAEIPIIGVNVYHKNSQNLHQKIMEIVSELQTEHKGSGLVSIPEDIVNIDNSYLGEGYGLPSKKTLDAIRLAASLEGIAFDPVYSGKALEAVVDKTILGDLDDYSDVILIHTGGASVLPVYQKAIAG